MSVLESYDPEISALLDEAKESLILSIPERYRASCADHSLIGFLTAMVRIAAYCKDTEEVKEAIRWQMECHKERAGRNAQ